MERSQLLESEYQQLMPDADGTIRIVEDPQNKRIDQATKSLIDKL